MGPTQKPPGDGRKPDSAAYVPRFTDLRTERIDLQLNALKDLVPLLDEQGLRDQESTRRTLEKQAARKMYDHLQIFGEEIQDLVAQLEKYGNHALVSELNETFATVSQDVEDGRTGKTTFGSYRDLKVFRAEGYIFELDCMLPNIVDATLRSDVEIAILHFEEAMKKLKNGIIVYTTSIVETARTNAFNESTISLEQLKCMVDPLYTLVNKVAAHVNKMERLPSLMETLFNEAAFLEKELEKQIPDKRYGARAKIVKDRLVAAQLEVGDCLPLSMVLAQPPEEGFNVTTREIVLLLEAPAPKEDAVKQETLNALKRLETATLEAEAIVLSMQMPALPHSGLKAQISRQFEDISTLQKADPGRASELWESLYELRLRVEQVHQEYALAKEADHLGLIFENSGNITWTNVMKTVADELRESGARSNAALEKAHLMLSVGYSRVLKSAQKKISEGLKEGITHLNQKMDAAMSHGSEEEMRRMYDLSKELYFSLFSNGDGKK